MKGIRFLFVLCHAVIPFVACALEGTFAPGGVASAGLRHLKPDTLLFADEGRPNNNNWEPYTSVLGTSTFLIQANTFALNAPDLAPPAQRFALALQPTIGGPHTLGEVFYDDAGVPYRGYVNLSRQDGNPGRVAGDKRPCAVNFIAGGEASPHAFPAFRSDARWERGLQRPADARYGTVQLFTLDLRTLQQRPNSKALDSANGRETEGLILDPQISRFGGDLEALDNGNFVSVVQDNSKLREHGGNATVATIFAPDGRVLKETFVVANRDIWCNVAAYKGGFCIRVAGVLYFFDNRGEPTGQFVQANHLRTSSGQQIPFDAGRGDTHRLASHINSTYVFLAGVAKPSEAPQSAIWLIAINSLTFNFAGAVNVSELTAELGGTDGAVLNANFDRSALAIDALNRVAVAYEAEVPGSGLQQVLVRVLEFSPSTQRFAYLTPSFHPFVNHSADSTRQILTQRPSISMTTEGICVAAKGVINRTNRPDQGGDTPPRSTFFTVLTHPAPQYDPTPPANDPGSRLATTTGLTATPIGSTEANGHAFSCDCGRYSLASGGIDLTNNNDRLEFAYEPLNGDFDKVVRVTAIASTDPADDWARAGLMARSTLQQASQVFEISAANPFGANVVRAGGRVLISTNGAPAEYRSWGLPVGKISETLPNQWLRLRRVGNNFSFFTGSNGRDWALLAEKYVYGSLPDGLWVGIFATATRAGAQATARFESYGDYLDPDRDPIRALSAGSLDGRIIGVRFNETVASASLTIPHFSVPGSRITKVETGQNGDAAYLHLADPITRSDGKFQVVIQDVTDAVGNAIAPGTTISGQIAGYTAMDIGVFRAPLERPALNDDPYVVGRSVATSSGETIDIDVVGGGSNIWEAGDFEHLLYRPIVGDFDFQVEIARRDAPNGGKEIFSHSGLQVRDELYRSGFPPNTREATKPKVYMATQYTFGEKAQAASAVSIWRQTAGTNYGVSSAVSSGATQAGVDGVRPGRITAGSASGQPPANWSPHANRWLRLKKQGDTFSAYWRYLPSEPWQLYHTHTLVMEGTNWVGFAEMTDTTGTLPEQYVTLTLKNFGPVTPSQLAQVLIWSQPEDVYVSANQPAVFRIGATNAIGGMRFQWRKDGFLIPGATGSVLSLNSVSLVHVGSYDCLVMADGKTVASRPARLSVGLPLVNPSFEADTFTNWPGYVDQNGPITGWDSLPSHGVNPGSNFSPFTDNGRIPHGSKAAFLQGDGTLSQVIPGFLPGHTYSLAYFENARTYHPDYSAAVEVQLGDQIIVPVHTLTPVGGIEPYRRVISRPFRASATSLKLSFIKSSPQGGDTSALIDNICLFEVPAGRLSIPGLFNTGVDHFGSPLPEDQADSHYRLVPPGVSVSTPRVAASGGGFPIPPWLGNNRWSAWIAPSADTYGPNQTDGSPNFYYQTAFDLTGMNHRDTVLSGRWSSDNRGVDILINGQSTGQSNGRHEAYTDWAPFSVTSGFLPGLNTLTFVLNNGSGESSLSGPTGLRVELSGSTTLCLGQWDFDNGSLSATAGSDLEFLGDTSGNTRGLYEFLRTDGIRVPHINGRQAGVLHIPYSPDPAVARALGLRLHHGFEPNGGGTKVNQWTLIMDVAWGNQGSNTFAAALQIHDPENTSDADLFWRASDGAYGKQCCSSYEGIDPAHNHSVMQWKRVVISADLSANPPVLAKYINGVLHRADTTGDGGKDQRFALLRELLLFADGDDNERRDCFVNSIQIRNIYLTGPEVAALGGPSADGIPFSEACCSTEVTNTNDSGPGSLRAAIECANRVQGRNLIRFAIPGVGPHRIQPVSPLPTITEAVEIDGYTQAGARPNTLPVGNDARLQVEIDGSRLLGNPVGLRLAAGGSVIRGLAINRFLSVRSSTEAALELTGPSNVVEGCFLGVDLLGSNAAPNYHGVKISNASGNRVGSPGPAGRNLISGNQGAGIWIQGALANENLVLGNYVGSDRTGLTRLGNSTGAFIEGGSWNRIGGASEGEGNLLTGSLQGPNLRISSGRTNIVQGNRIGVDCRGIASLGSSYYGVYLDLGGGNILGGILPGAGNIISGNARGIEIGSPGTIIAGNKIGTDITGTRPLGNQGYGILCLSPYAGQGVNSSGSIIGGTNLGAGNIIAFNLLNGIKVGGTGKAPFAKGVSVLGNAIHDNGDQVGSNALGVDLSPLQLSDSIPGDGPTPNDLTDADDGPNGLQNFPVLRTATRTGNNIAISGTLSSAPNAVYRIELFANTEASRTGYGEGEVFVGFARVATDSIGNSGFSVTIPATPGKDIYSATATDGDGNTSEFSAALQALTVSIQDADGDGMPDSWEASHGLNPNDPSDEAKDADSDGLTNAQEYRADTDPRDPTSHAVRLVPRGSSWKYFDRARGLDTEWSESPYPDGDWPYGFSPFGYGDSGVNPVTTLASEPITTYFRRRFLVADVHQLTNLTLSIWVNDGAVVYLNGREAGRVRMGDGTVTGGTLAQPAPLPVTELARLSLDPSWLEPEENLIAVEVHQSTMSSPEMLFDLELSAARRTAAPLLTVEWSSGSGPQLAGDPPSQLDVSWEDTTSQFKLQTKTDLSSTEWSQIVSGLTNFGSRHRYSFVPTGGRAFLRLFSTNPPSATPSPPVESAHPLEVSADKGATLLLSIPVEAQGPCTYQWRKNQIPIASATNATFLKQSIQRCDSGAYDLCVCCPGGCITCTPIYVKVGGDEASLADAFASRPVFTDQALELNFDNIGALREPAEPRHPTFDPGKTVWMKWIAPGDGLVTVDTCASGQATALAVYTGSTLPALTLEASAGYGQPDLTSKLQFFAHGGQEYSIAVDGSGPLPNLALDLTWKPSPGPVIQIVRHPLHTTSEEGTGARFEVEVKSVPNVGETSLQWFKYETPLAGETRPVLNLDNVRYGDVAMYWVQISNSVTHLTANSERAALSMLTSDQTLVGGKPPPPGPRLQGIGLGPRVGLVFPQDRYTVSKTLSSVKYSHYAEICLYGPATTTTQHSTASTPTRDSAYYGDRNLALQAARLRATTSGILSNQGLSTAVVIGFYGSVACNLGLPCCCTQNITTKVGCLADRVRDMQSPNLIRLDLYYNTNCGPNVSVSKTVTVSWDYEQPEK